jgi:predicted TIM-barrel fold metal-dependent hydrolase
MTKDDRSCASPPRRQFLGGVAALGAGMLAAGCQQQSSPAPASSAVPAASVLPNPPRLIDVHHHFGSPGWIKRLRVDQALNRSWDDYTPAKDIELMDKAGIATAIVSPTTPGVWLVDGYGANARPKPGVPKQTVAEARVMTRELNEFGAKMMNDYKGRFGVMAALALPDIDGSLKEIEYCLDTLKVQGFGIMTSHGNHWLGDPLFTPVFEELNRRKAIVYTHPTAAPCCRDLIPGLGPTAIEYHTDTTRAVMSWISSGSAKRFPDVRWIHSHGGGTIPILAGRILGGDSNLAEEPKPDSTLYFLRKYYYDTRHIDNQASSVATKRMFGASQLLFGYVDIPNPNAMYDGVTEFKKLEDTGEFTAEELRGMARGNALTLFPEFA